MAKNKNQPGWFEEESANSDIRSNLECDQDQMKLFLQCVQNRNVDEWNRFRQTNPDTPIRLDGITMKNASLQGVDLSGSSLRNANFDGCNFHLAILNEALLDGACFANTAMFLTKLHKVFGRDVCFAGANLRGATMTSVALLSCDFKDAILARADITKGSLAGSDLRGAELDRARLMGTSLFGVKMQGASFVAAVVDGETWIDTTEFDFKTNFASVGLSAARCVPGLRSALEYNVRAISWRNWLNKPWWAIPLKLPVKLFWSLSRHGSSTYRILVTFFTLAFVFAWCYHSNPSLVIDTTSEGNNGSLPFLRMLYFSIVTMTTLGFGDVLANPQSPWGHILIITQVLAGYVILAALVTRLAVAFSADGPMLHPASRGYFCVIGSLLKKSMTNKSKKHEVHLNNRT